MTEKLMEIRDVTQRFRSAEREVVAVSRVSVQVDAGSVTCLVGESGSGKTTLARIAAGLDKPTAGSIHYRGQDISQLRGPDFMRFRREVQYVHQDPYASLNPTRTVLSTLLSALGARRNRTRRRATELLERVELTPADLFLERYPHQLSGGQRQRVALARALATRPRAMLIDEPFAAVDVEYTPRLRVAVKAALAEVGCPSIIVTHDPADVAALADDVAVLENGRIVEHGPVAEVMASPGSSFGKLLFVRD